MNGMNFKGGMDDIITALVGLLVAIITFLVVMQVWQPITGVLYPLLNNAAAFTYGSTAVTLLQLFVLVAVAALFLAFFNEARGERRPPTVYG